jgi:hypothetical protein
MISDKVYLDSIGFINDSDYRLELRWNKVVYDKNICRLNGAYFCGPVLNKAEEIQPNDYILLDMYKQYYIFSLSVYIINLSWGNVKHNTINNKVSLSNVVLTHPVEMNKVPKLRNKDYILINTKGHDIETHYNFPTYKAMVLNEFGEAYKFYNVEGSFRKV